MNGYRIVAVVDTRDAKWEGGRWVVQAGTGVPQGCSVCGRDHEVVVLVEDTAGHRVKMGMGCAVLRTGVVRADVYRGVRAERRRLIAEAVARGDGPQGERGRDDRQGG